MTIDGEGPFIGKRVTIYKRNTDNRVVTTIQSTLDSSRTTMTYARYLMSVNKNRTLAPTEHVDHIDENKSNDDIDNLQILSKSENTHKNQVFRHNIGRIHVQCICPICGDIFELEIKRFNAKDNTPVCSLRCAGKISGSSRRGESSLNRFADDTYIEDGYSFEKFVVGYCRL